MKNLRKNNQREILEIKGPFSKANKQTKHNGRPLQQTRTNGRQNLKA
jgi:hypothetical protein